MNPMSPFIHTALCLSGGAAASFLALSLLAGPRPGPAEAAPAPAIQAPDSDRQAAGRLCEGPEDRVPPALERRLASFRGELAEVRLAKEGGGHASQVKISFLATPSGLEAWLASESAPAVFYREVRVSGAEGGRLRVEMIAEVPCD